MKDKQNNIGLSSQHPMLGSPTSDFRLPISAFWRGKRVLVTGHTGFKGSWICLWLKQLGADIHGFALSPDTEPALFEQLGLADEIHHQIGDIRNYKETGDRRSEVGGRRSEIGEYVMSVQPDVVIHLAAQPLVRRSYREPLLTWQTNVLGTVNLLESLRQLDKRCAVVIVTTDKVYEESQLGNAYKENDRIGGHDPYSSSKSAVELAAASWRDSFFAAEGKIRLATARAGNVIGGGDWAEDRILPDLARAVISGNKLVIRNPTAIRPWQHVLDPLAGYMLLAQELYEQKDAALQSAFNFGPDTDAFRTVGALVLEARKYCRVESEAAAEVNAPHEAAVLALNAGKAHKVLQWRPRWDFTESVQQTVEWYQAYKDGAAPRELCEKNIQDYSYI